MSDTPRTLLQRHYPYLTKWRFAVLLVLGSLFVYVLMGARPRDP